MLKFGKMHVKCVLVALAALMLTGCGGGSPEFFKLIKVTETVGSVSVDRKDESMDAYADMNMEAGDLMETGIESHTRMVFDGTTYAMMESESKVLFAADGKGKDAGLRVELEKGGIFTEFTEGMGAINSYSVKTPSAIAAVRGTVFYVREYEENGKSITRISVVEGSVAATLLDAEGNATEETATIPAGKEAVISNDGSAPVFEIKEQDIDFEAIPAELLDYVRVRIGEGTSDEMKHFFRDGYLEDAERLASEEKYADSLVDYDEIIEVMPGDTVMRESLSATVEDYKDKLVEEKRFGTAEELLDRYEEYADRIDYEEVRADITELKEKDAVVRAFMQTAYDTMMAEDYDALVGIYDSDEIKDIIETIGSMGDDRYVFFLDAEGERTGKAVGIYTYRYPVDREMKWEDDYYLYAGEYVDYRRNGEGRIFSTIDGGGYSMSKGECADDAPEGRWEGYSVGSRSYMVNSGSYEYNKSETSYTTYSKGIKNGPDGSSTINARDVELKREANFVNGVPDKDISDEFANAYSEFRSDIYEPLSYEELVAERNITPGTDHRIYYYTETSDGYMYWWYQKNGDIDGFGEYATYAPRDF